MKQISLGEFKERTEAILRARKIFIPHLTKNISIAFELYQGVLAEESRKLTVSTKEGGRMQITWLDQYERPSCPQCKEPLYLRRIEEPKGQGNRKGWKTCWECLAPNCLYESYSKKDVRKWLKRLKRRKDA